MGSFPKFTKLSSSINNNIAIYYSVLKVFNTIIMYCICGQNLINYDGNH